MSNKYKQIFTTPYVYGGENLVVEIKNTTAGSTYMQIPFYGQQVADHINATPVQPACIDDITENRAWLAVQDINIIKVIFLV